MPSIRKKNAINFKVQTLSNIEEDSELVKDLKEHFTLENFLEYEETYDILETNWFFAFADKCEKEIWDFYEHECSVMKRKLSTLFYYDTDGSGMLAGKLSAIVFANIKPQYDLDYIYKYPHLARPLIEDRDNKKKRGEEERRRLIQENYEETVKKRGKTFNWATKTYK